MKKLRKLPRPAGAARRPTAPPAPQRLDDEWRAWIGENLLLGASVEVIAEHLARKGAPAPLIAAEIQRAQASPYLRSAETLRTRLAKRDWLLAGYGRLAALDEELATVPIEHAPDADDFFRRYYARHRPAVLTGLVDHWPAATRWSLDHFAALLPDDPQVQVQTGREGDAAYEQRSEHHRTPMRWSQLLAMLRADPTTNDFYVTANNGGVNREALAPLWDELGELPGILAPGGASDGFFWMGPRGTITPFHHDLTNNLLVQIRGRKRVILVPSWETPRMRNQLHCYTAFTGPAEIAALPPADRPMTIECTIGPGQALFIPVGWWHHVEGLDMTIGLSFTAFARDNDFYSSYASYGRM